MHIYFAQLYAHCHRSPKTEVITFSYGYPHVESYTKSETVYLDNDSTSRSGRRSRCNFTVKVARTYAKLYQPPHSCRGSRRK